MQIQTNDYQKLITKCTALKTIQDEFIINNRFNHQDPYKAPEIADSPTKWIKEYKAFGGSYDKPSTLQSRLQKLLELTHTNSNFKDIIDLVNTSSNDNIIWDIEKIYKSGESDDTSFVWNAFIFSLIASAISSRINNTAWNKWNEAHKDGWMLAYRPP